jgi:DNA repair protein RecN (Recombination protein N)
MLKNLLIKNYALIERLELQPAAELNIVTGETGAGKSIMLGALGLLLGNRADTKVLFDQEQKCIIEGTFDISGYDLKELFEQEDIDFDNTCLVRREISPSGKSRAFVNDTPVTLEVLKALSTRLMDVHSQHDTMQLGSNTFQINIVDAYAQNKRLLEGYKNTYRQFKKAESDYQTLISEAAQAKKELDFNNFLLQELQEAKLQEGEQEALESELQVLENAEEIKIKLNQVLDLLQDSEQCSVSTLNVSANILDKISRYSGKFSQLSERLNSTLIEIKDIASEVSEEEAATELNAERIEFIQSRLSLLFTLQKKHQVQTVEELIQIEQQLDKEVSKVLNLDEEILEKKQELDRLTTQLTEEAAKLSESRKAAIPHIEQELKSLLAEIGIPNATIKINQQNIPFSSSGADNIQFLFSANKGVTPQELKNVASGGEFSRLMLSIKYILADKTALPTIIFDEIDTGISGEIAIKVGSMMKQMARNHQIIVITHLPQIAARGLAHYYVYKDNSSERTISRIRQLNEDERVNEIAQMISGEPPSEISLKNARELLESN